MDFVKVDRKNEQSSVYFYYTPINNRINFQLFKDYGSQHMSTVDDEVADIMANIEEMIISSLAFKNQISRPKVDHNKWQSFKVKKIPLTSLFMILNKINNDNLEIIVEETLQYKTFKLNEIEQLADVFLGKCIMETRNVLVYIEYFKRLMDNKLWYVRDGDNIISFKDLMLDTLEKEYNRLARIASHIEDVYKNQINDSNMYSDDGTEDYIKKKNIIISLINLIGSFYNGKIISTSLLINIFDNLKEQYLENPSCRKIYLELWLVLWKQVSNNLYFNYRNIYDDYYLWLSSEQTVNCDRLSSLIMQSLDKKEDQKEDIQERTATKIVGYEECSFYDIPNLLESMLNENKYSCLDMYSENVLEKLITKYLVEQCISDHKLLSITIDRIRDNILPKDKLDNLINNMLKDDDIICDYPKFGLNIRKYN